MAGSLTSKASSFQKELMAKCLLLNLEWELLPDGTKPVVLVIHDEPLKYFILHNGKLWKAELYAPSNVSDTAKTGIVLQQETMLKLISSMEILTNVFRDKATAANIRYTAEIRMLAEDAVVIPVTADEQKKHEDMMAKAKPAVPQNQGKKPLPKLHLGDVHDNAKLKHPNNAYSQAHADKPQAQEKSESTSVPPEATEEEDEVTKAEKSMK